MITQNGKSFDIKWCNAAFLRHNLPPPSPYKVIDTKVEAKKYLALPSYSLDNMADYFGVGRKMEHEGFSLWLKCAQGDKNAWRRMKRYNARDVVLTEKVYLLLKPFIKSHPNIGLYAGKKVCTKCGSDKINSRGLEYTNSGIYRRVICKSCGSWMRDFQNLNEIKQYRSI